MGADQRLIDGEPQTLSLEALSFAPSCLMNRPQTSSAGKHLAKTTKGLTGDPERAEKLMGKVGRK